MKIEKLQKKGSRYKIVLDNGEEINTNAEVILNNNLLYDKDIDEKLLDKINSDTLYYDVYNKVINKIMTKWRSQYEVRKFLLDSGISLDDTNKIVKNLIDIGLINDKRFIKCFVNDKINLTMDGPNKMIRSLEDYKVDMDEVYRIIDQISEEEIDRRIDKLVMKKVCSNKKYSAYMLKQKIIQYLINLGYEKKDIERHLDKIKTDESLLKKEMDKIAFSLSKKYEGDLYNKKLKEKLFRKGFSSDEINEYIKNSS